MSNWEVYQRQAEAYAASRNTSLFERPWLDRVLADVPKGGAVLDLGCGAGAPIGVFLSDAGYDVTGVDYAPAMLALYTQRLPQARVIEADMRSLSLVRQFDAIIGWGSFFHLTQEAQRAALPTIAGHLAPGGRLLLTVGPGAGEVWGTVAGERVFHASLSPEDYAEILTTAGAPVEAFVPEDPEAHGHTLLMARRAV